MELKLDLQLFGGGGGGGGSDPEPVKKTAPGSQAAATIDQADAETKRSMADKMRSAFNLRRTNTTGGQATLMVDSIKKALTGQ